MLESRLSIPVLRLISDYIDHYAAIDPERECLVFGAQRLSYKETRARIDRMAQALIASGVEPGDRVAFLSTSRLEFWLHFLAVTDIGAIWLGLNPKYTQSELEYLIKDAEPRMIFGFPELLGKKYTVVLDALARHESVQELVWVGEDEPTKGSNGTAWSDFSARADSIDRTSLEKRRAAVDTMDPAFMVYTSGSTGKPKGTLLTHYGQIFTGVVGVERKGLRERRMICNLPINHVGAIGDICARTMIGGGTIFFHEEFNPALMMADTEKERLDVFAAPPTIFQICMNHPDFASRDLSSIELLAWGGAAMPLDVLRTFREKTGARFCTVGYGMTETVGGVTFSELEDTNERLVETIGTPDKRLPLRIWLNDEEREAAIGEEGEIQVCGDFLMKAYWRRPQDTVEAFTKDGWMHTGDLAKLRSDGHILFTGRLSQMFKSGGYNVYPMEIELCLQEHPDVDIAAVVGVPDPMYQEVGYAYVVLSENCSVDEEILRAWCKERLANYKVPKRFIITRELPLLPIGKVDKVRLMELVSPRARVGGGSE